MREIWDKYNEFIIGVVFSGVVVSIMNYYLKLSTYEEIVAGSLLFLCGYVIANFREMRSEEDNDRIIIKEIDQNLKVHARLDSFIDDLNLDLDKISDDFHRLATKYGVDDIWIHWYRDKIKLFGNQIRSSINNQTFEFNEDIMSERWNLFNTLMDIEYVYSVAKVGGISYFYSIDGTEFFKDLLHLQSDGKLKSIRRLFVYNSISDLDMKELSVLIYLHEQCKWESRVLLQNEFDYVFNKNGDLHMIDDFGIYGGKFVWETPAKNVFNQLGYMSRDIKKINKYKSVFEILWNHGKIMKVTDPDIVKKCQGLFIYDFRDILLDLGLQLP